MTEKSLWWLHVAHPKLTISSRVTTSVTNIKLTNVFMMLRKCCNHPYMLEFPMTLDGHFKVDEELVSSSGKIMLLDRMIPALIKGGHKVVSMYMNFCVIADMDQCTEVCIMLRGIWELRHLQISLVS